MTNTMPAMSNITQGTPPAGATGPFFFGLTGLNFAIRCDGIILLLAAM
jgi:hypothetical protein